MDDYIYTRRYDSPVYWIMLMICACVSVAFLLAPSQNLVTIAFSALFAFGACALFVGIRDRCRSGLIIDASTLRWYRTAPHEHDDSLELSAIRRVDWQHFDAEWIVVTLSDDTTIKLDERYFGDGNAVLRAIQSRTNDVLFFDEGRQWNGEPTRL